MICVYPDKIILSLVFSVSLLSLYIYMMVFFNVYVVVYLFFSLSPKPEINTTYNNNARLKQCKTKNSSCYSRVKNMFVVPDMSNLFGSQK